MTLSISLHMLARSPIPGRVKTRLIPALGEEGACDMQRRLLARALALPATGFSQRFVWLDDLPDPELEEQAERHGWTLVEQPAGDLGERMRRIATLGLVASDAVVLIGNDCPALDGAYLQTAREALHLQPVVIGPAEDGGYVLLGLRQIDPALFSHLPWGTDQVLALTRQRVEQLGWGLELLSELWDVDRPEDLSRLASLGIALDS
ncbi:MAG: TIGR04282 family arsenosugar biosynthesis glycosyltransferase [Gammaproteobacteria bacterium]|nr:TIGR04282 family arsenosugar biosynthesis glycosyltransferase [Gammaproteobacteria bacterium]MBU1488614.1 TIGR04282 family arsenosugar biosynthesis glycosyltransferase [Gammaproteobacteria bacterium]MBU2064739.1 TIGR04282 family arsenosugar biosynthesis glycosyltransferase [Gammaproteobacteria bacterium]MBU2137970.1 TIGR04282 family arsenosugar biosynthesis glycosyltransferase [Gammaproteobacteria bacterium]MBU2215110.1 TIGR04282 family arsenosugar biosynthesis glycosyltransferase [Gammaprot